MLSLWKIPTENTLEITVNVNNIAQGKRALSRHRRRRRFHLLHRLLPSRHLLPLLLPQLDLSMLGPRSSTPTVGGMGTARTKSTLRVALLSLTPIRYTNAYKLASTIQTTRATRPCGTTGRRSAFARPTSSWSSATALSTTSTFICAPIGRRHHLRIHHCHHRCHRICRCRQVYRCPS